MKISKYVFIVGLVFFLTSCDEIARQFGYVSASSISESSTKADTQKAQEENKRVKENIANYVKIIWNDGSFCIQNDTDYTLEKVSVMTSWTQNRPNEWWKKDAYQESRQFTFIPAHSKSTAIEYDKFVMNDVKGQIYEIKCSALGLY